MMMLHVVPGFGIELGQGNGRLELFGEGGLAVILRRSMTARPDLTKRMNVETTINL
jgi:hypothetical protein